MIDLKCLLSIFIIVFFISCRGGKIDNEVEQLNARSNLATKLCEMYGLDQGIREKEIFKVLAKVSPKIDSLNFRRLVEFVKEYGMPNEDLLGVENYKIECVQLAAFSILLHSPHRLVNEKEFYDLFINEVFSKRMDGKVFALIIDKYYWAHKKNVLYGSQFGKPCIEDKSVVNSRRKIIGLKELEDLDFKMCN